MIWRELLNLFTGHEAPDAPPSWAPHQPMAELPDDQARAALMQTGLCHGRDADVAIVKAAIGSVEFPTGIDLRRRGTQLRAGELRAMGVRANAILTREYVAILTSAGLANPIEAAHSLVSAYSSRLADANRQGRVEHAGIKFVEVIPNNMAAGPCQACLSLAEKPMPIADAPSGPLPACPHPTQCHLWVRSLPAIS